MIQLIGVHKRFGSKSVLAGVDVEIPATGVTFLVGRSGAGKSVLARCAVGLMRVDAGEVHLNGQRIDGLPERQLIELRRQYPYVVQSIALLDWLDLRTNISLILVRALNLSKAEARDRAEEALSMVGLTDWWRCMPPEVGPGACKRVAIARALALKPRAVLYDEPTTGLDMGAARRVDELISQAAKKGIPALIISHDRDSLRRIADRVAVIEEGRIGFSGTAEKFLEGRGEVHDLRIQYRR